MARDDQRHECGSACFRQEAGSGSWTKIDEKDEEDLQRDNLKKVGRQTHAPHDNVCDQAFVEVEHGCHPNIVKEHRFFVTPEVRDVRLVTLDKFVHFLSLAFEGLRPVCPARANTGEKAFDQVSDNFGFEEEDQKNCGDNVKNDGAECQNELKFKIAEASGHPSENEESGDGKKSQSCHKIHDADRYGAGDIDTSPIEHVDLSDATACLKGCHRSQEDIGKIGFKCGQESVSF